MYLSDEVNKRALGIPGTEEMWSYLPHIYLIHSKKQDQNRKKSETFQPSSDFCCENFDASAN